jgi:hypothetical protein
MTIKWFVAALFVAAGVFAVDNRDFLIDAYEVDDEVTTVTEASFDNIARRMEERRAVSVELDTGSFEVPNTRGIDLPRTTPSEVEEEELEIEGGRVTVRGRVLDGTDGVGGASVSIERIVGDRSAQITLTADGNGRYEAANLQGGLYRIRAWRAPDLSMQQSQVHFVSERQVLDANLAVNEEADSRFTATFDSGEARVGRSYTVSVEFRSSQVNAEGIIEDAPVANQITLIEVSDPLVLESRVIATSGRDGIARFSMRCSKVGQGRIVVIASGNRRNVSVPSCQLPPRPTATQVSIGGGFNQPTDRVVPRGTYEARVIPVVVPTTEAGGTDGGDGGNGGGQTGSTNSPTTNAPATTAAAGNGGAQGFVPLSAVSSAFQDTSQCRLEFQVWAQVGWGPIQTHVGGGQVTFGDVARIRTNSAAPCRYVRVSR